MILSRVLTEALPELPPRQPDRKPRVYPNLISREHVERDGVYVRSLIPGGPAHYFRLSKRQHEVAMLFDGNRTFSEVAAACSSQLGFFIDEAEVQTFADMLDSANFFYKTPQEESEIIAHELTEKRRQVIKHKHANIDPNTIEIYYFNPDKMLEWMYAHFKWMYSPWWFAWSIAMIAVMFAILGSHWSMLWNDTVYFYNLTAQPLYHVAEFFGIFLVLSFMHESAHGMSCYHYGGRSHRMGFFLIYLMPGVFCDAAEAFVRAGRWGRIVTVAAGIWSEIVLCSYLAVVWWLTPPGSIAHDVSYIFILSGGVLAVSFNWNPLARMDGYFIFCDLLHFHDLKGQSTYYMVSVVRKYIFRMPAQVPALPPLRRIGFATYALLSGAYSYFLLGALCRLSYRLMSFYWPLWAFVPATLLAWLIFRGRVKKLLKFFRELYIDKREVMRANRKKLLLAGAAAAVLVSVPLRRDVVEQPFVLEPVHRAVLRTQVPGQVIAIGAKEGESVAAGAVIAEMRDVGLDSRVARAATELRVAQAEDTRAHLSYAGLATADQRLEQASKVERIAREQQQNLQLRTPISGVVVTPRVHDLMNTYVAEGTEIAEVADLSQLRARVFVEEPEMRKLRDVRGNSLLVKGSWKSLHGELSAISATPREVTPGLMPPLKYQGMHPDAYFAVDFVVPNVDGRLRDGMTGTAKIYGPRRSLAVLMLQPVYDAISRRLW